MELIAEKFVNFEELRAHLVAEHDVSQELADLLSKYGLIVMHVGAHESDEQ